MQNINAVCSNGGEFPHQDYSFRECALAMCNQFVIIYELC